MASDAADTCAEAADMIAGDYSGVGFLVRWLGYSSGDLGSGTYTPSGPDVDVFPKVEAFAYDYLTDGRHVGSWLDSGFVQIVGDVVAGESLDFSVQLSDSTSGSGGEIDGRGSNQACFCSDMEASGDVRFPEP